MTLRLGYPFYTKHMHSKAIKEYVQKETEQKHILRIYNVEDLHQHHYEKEQQPR